MVNVKTLKPVALLLLAAVYALTPAFAAKPKPLPDHWVGTWATAPFALENTGEKATFGLADTTLRQFVHTSLAGPLVRLELSNEFGTEPLIIGAVHIALAGPDATTTGDIALASANALTFSGSPTITIPPGGFAISDSAAITLPAQATLAVSLFLPAQKISRVTFHNAAYATSFLAPGNQVSAHVMSQTRTATSFYFLKAVDVRVPGQNAAIVAFGDSITDGAASTRDANARWPDVLATRLQANPATRSLGVLNLGIGGNRVLRDGTGPNAIARFDRDVLGQSGVRYVIFLEGINDLSHAKDPVKPYDDMEAKDLILTLSQLAERAHAHGIKVFAATLTPYDGYKTASPAGELVRQQYNAWIRSNKGPGPNNVLAGFIDFDKATLDPAHPDSPALAPAFDSGDHLHPKDAGYKAMGDSIDLNLFQQK